MQRAVGRRRLLTASVVKLPPSWPSCYNSTHRFAAPRIAARGFLCARVMPISVTSHHGFDTTRTTVDGRVFERQEHWTIYVIEPDADRAAIEAAARRGQMASKRRLDWVLLLASMILPVLLFGIWLQR